jgi:SAM-dependent methyltransferase
MNDHPDHYERLASDYEQWLVLDAQRDGTLLLRTFAPLLSALPAAARILDCACGTGHNALSLARRGFRVAASDASAAMLAVARQNAAALGEQRVTFSVCDYRFLPENFKEKFDAVFCVGNSIAHAGGGEEMVRALRSMRSVVGRGSWLALDGRNWEKLRERGRYVERSEPVKRAGVECVVLREWDEIREWDAEHIVKIVLTLRDGGRMLRREHILHYFPYTQDALVERLNNAGFGDVSLYGAEGAWPTLTARAA